MPITPEDASRRGRIAAYRMHATNDSKVTSQPGRDAFMGRFEREVDPDGVLPVEERLRRAGMAKRAYFTALAYKSAKARRAKKGSK